jgi:hypothetical protein
MHELMDECIAMHWCMSAGMKEWADIERTENEIMIMTACLDG